MLEFIAMERKINSYLVDWLNNSVRKPLIIRGARQVGKTWLVRNLANVSEKRLVELNFERDPQLGELFYSNDPQKTLLAIKTALNITVKPSDNILFLDEIQAAPQLLAKLRWFAEEIPELPIIATGSLLEFALAEHKFSMPVGRISYVYLEPMSFQEFLLASGQKNLCDFLGAYELPDLIPQPIDNLLRELMDEYLIVGGMPEAVKSWVTSRNILKVNEVQRNLIRTYRDDFAKYKGKVSNDRLEEIFRVAPALLGQKFKYSAINPDLSAASIKAALTLLCKAQICYKVNNCSGNGIPLGAEVKDRNYKIIFLDVGLVSLLSGIHNLSSSDVMKILDSPVVNKGKLSEQLVG
jgi:uncharacterized protein